MNAGNDSFLIKSPVGFGVRALQLFALGACCTVASVASAAIFEDDFSDGNRNGWYSTSSTSRAISVVDGRLLLPTAGSGAGSFLTYFDSQTLDVGQGIKLSFNFTYSGETHSNNVRFGLLNSSGFKIANDVTSPAGAIGDGFFTDYRGYAGFQNFADDSVYQELFYRVGGGANNNNLWTNTNTGTFVTSVGGTNRDLNIVNDGEIIYNAEFSIFRDGETSVVVSSIVNGVEVRFTHEGASNFSFDTIGFYVNRPGTSMSFDNFKVETFIPEASTYALTLGALVLLGCGLYRIRSMG